MKMGINRNVCVDDDRRVSVRHESLMIMACIRQKQVQGNADGGREEFSKVRRLEYKCRVTFEYNDDAGNISVER